MEINFRSAFDYELIGQKNLYIWELKRFIKWNDYKIIGSYKSNITDLGNNITYDTLVNILNKLECFDFEYIPCERDFISIKYSNKKMYIYYKDNKWNEGIPPLMKIISKRIGYGYLNILNNE